jgi:peroxiredoxin/outer membrane lipoprotein-sorting protein
MMKMKRAIVSLAACAVLAGSAYGDAQGQAALDAAQKAYSGLRAFHAITVTSQTIHSGMANLQAPDVESELAEKAGGKFRARYKANDQESIEVSNGSQTWKALPKAKEWSKIEAAGVNRESDDAGEGVKPARDLHSNAKDTVLLRYPALAKLATDPVVLKEDNFKLGKEKRRCYIVRTRVKDRAYDFWIDEATHFMVQEVQTTHSQLNGADAENKLTTKFKVIETNDDVDDSLFQFAPEPSWREVEMLVLPGEERTSLAGLKAANFSAKSLDGDSVELSSLRGKVVVLDFWATWCPPCREELPTVDKLRAEFGDKVQFFGISDEDAGTVKGFLRKNNNGLPTLMDQKETVHRQYGVSAIPTLLVIDRDGVIRSHFIGGRSPETLRDAIAKVLGQ